YSHMAGLGALLGHVFPIWLWFRGGKGGATFVGVLIAMNGLAATVFGLIWLGVAGGPRYFSPAALSPTAGAVVFYLVTGWAGLPFILAMAALIFLKHLGNIRRLLEGRESKIGART